MTEHYDINAEVSLIASILTDNSRLASVIYIEEKHFLNDVHKKLFTAIKDIISEGREANPITVISTIGADDDLKKYIYNMFSGGRQYLDYRTIAHELNELWRYRELDRMAILIHDYSNSGDSGELLSEIIGQCTQLQENGSMKQIRCASRVYQELYDDFLTDDGLATSTGFSRLDKAMLGGFHRGRCYFFAGRPKAAKTIALGSIANNLNNSGHKTLFIAAEMGDKQILQRMVAHNINRGSAAFYEDRANMVFQEELKNYKTNDNLMFYNAPRITFNELRGVVYSAVNVHKVEGVFLDYLQLVSGRGQRSVADHIEDVAQWIAEVCKRENIWICAAAQLNREGRVRGSDGAIMAGDQIYEICSPDEDSRKRYFSQTHSRYTALMDVGDEVNPAFEISIAPSLVEI